MALKCYLEEATPPERDENKDSQLYLYLLLLLLAINA